MIAQMSSLNMEKGEKVETIKSILESTKYSLPIRNYDDDMHLYLKRKFDDYISELGKSIDDDYLILNIGNVKKIEELSNSILKTIINYYHGLRNDAFLEFEKAMKIAEKYLLLDNISSEEMQKLYRIRYGDNNLFSKEEMFHIPFEKRSIIKSQRYSIPGFPALYLGSSSYICWDEMKRPNFQNIHISKFEFIPDKKYQILDIGLRPKDVVKLYKESSDEDRKNIKE